MQKEELYPTPCRNLLQQIRAIDFAITETVLYLDAYPDHPRAMQYYHQLISERKRLVTSYESACGPLTHMGNESSMTWDWTRTPFPWEKEANET